MASTLINFFSPLGHIVGLLWLGLWLLLIYLARRKERRAVFLVLLLIGLMWAAGTPLFSRMLMGQLEKPYRSVNVSDLAAADAVVLLGGAYRESKSHVFGLDLTDAADRLVVALELVRQQKGKALVLGGRGHAPEYNPSDKELMTKWCERWRLPVTNIFSLGAARDTHEEAVATQALAKQNEWQRIILVTSAHHMKRAEAIFRKAGLTVQPAPCDFRTRDPDYRPSLNKYIFPSVSFLEVTDLYLHEAIGWWVSRAQGWL